MKRKSIAIILSTILAAGLLLTGCDENGLPTEDDFAEITSSLDEFSAMMEEVTANVDEMTGSIEEITDAAEDIEAEINVVVDGDIIDSLESIDEVSEIADSIVDEAEVVVDAMEAIDPDIEKLATDVVNGYDNVGVIAEDIVNIYTKEEVQQLINELEAMTK